MSNVVDFKPAQIERFKERMQVAESLTVALMVDLPVKVNGIEYTLNDVVTNILADQEQREVLTANWINLLTSSMDQEVLAISRMNQMLLSGTKELAFQLAGDALAAKQVINASE